MTDEIVGQLGFTDDGKLVAFDPETGDQIPVPVEQMEIDEASVGTVDETDPEAVTNVDYVESNSGVDTLDPTEVEEAATAESNNSLALGRDAWAHTEKGPLALGNEAEASGEYSVAIGSGDDGESYEDPAVANGLRSISIGPMSNTSNEDAIAIGMQSFGSGFRSLAIGRSSTSTGEYSISLGYNPDTSGDEAISLGNRTESVSAQAISIGERSGVQGDWSTEDPIHDNTVAIGANAGVEADEDVVWNSSSSVALGKDARLSDASRSIAIGSNDTADRGAHAQADDAIAIGTEASADGESSVSIGTGVSNDVDDTARIGTSQLVFGGSDTLTDADLNDGEVALFLDEANSEIKARIQESDGTNHEVTLGSYGA